MAHAKEKCNKRSLTDEPLLHLATQGPGYKIEKATLKIKTKKRKPGEGNTRYTSKQIGICKGGKITQARGVI